MASEVERLLTNMDDDDDDKADATLGAIFGSSTLTARQFLAFRCAALCWLMGAGFAPNMIEVGGASTATLNAVGNTLANLWGLLVPILGVQLRARFNSFMPLFLQAICFNIIGAALFARHAWLTSPLEDAAAAEVPAQKAKV